jgi:hypothetical protein
MLVYQRQAFLKLFFSDVIVETLDETVNVQWLKHLNWTVVAIYTFDAIGN